MALRSGMNITASDMKKLLEENDRTQKGVRSWRERFGNTSLGYTTATDTLRSNYTDVIAQAYKSNLAQQNAILGSNMNVGAMSDAVAMSRADLHNAYSQYISNYRSQQNDLTSTYGGQMKSIEDTLTDRAKNFASLYSNAYTYLSDVLNQASYNENNLNEPLYDDDDNLTGYNQTVHDYLADHQMSGYRIKDANNKETGELLSWDQLSYKLFNPDGSLNKEGIKFFDQVFNARTEGYFDEEGKAIRSFDEWLSETDPELREWYTSQDEFNYNFAGTNKGTAATMVGRKSTDDVYNTTEYVDVEDAAKVNSANRKVFRSFVPRIVGKTEVQDKILSAYKENFNSTETYAQKNTKKAIDEVAETYDDYRISLQKGFSDAYSFIRSNFGDDLAKEFEAETQGLLDEYYRLNARYKTISSDMAYAGLSRTNELPKEFYEAYGYRKNTYGEYVDAKGKSISEKDRLTKYHEWMTEQLENWFSDTEEQIYEFNSIYDQFTKRMDDFIKKHGYSGTSSGL